MTSAPAFAAVDLGAESGRVVVGRLSDGRVDLEELHRFPNHPVRLPDGLRWNLLHLFSEALKGLRAAGTVDGIGIDSWGVDYALLDERRRMLGLPFHYRDERTSGMIERAFERAPPCELYSITGIQTLPINTVFQLLADEDSAALAAADRIAFVPDLFAFWLTGELQTESTIASTSGLLAAHSGRWARTLIERLGLPTRIFGELVEPGYPIGSVLAHHGLGRATVWATASHDTAAAFAAAPLRDDSCAAVLSSGTWSLLGLELAAPVLDDPELTNERGIEGTIRLLKNVMGLWLLQECGREWGASYEELVSLAEGPMDDVPLFDPDDPSLIAPGGMPTRIAGLCDRPPEDRGALVRGILASLACKYRVALERLERVTGGSVERVHVIGGGSRNAVLCRLTADVLDRPVLAGPVEATALGNVLVQARAAGALGSQAELRAVAAASADPVTYAPSDAVAAAALYRRFLDTTRTLEPTS